MMLRCVFCGERVCAGKREARRAIGISACVAAIVAVAVSACAVL